MTPNVGQLLEIEGQTYHVAAMRRTRGAWWCDLDAGHGRRWQARRADLAAAARSGQIRALGELPAGMTVPGWLLMQDPASAELRALWDADGVQPCRQAYLLLQIARKAGAAYVSQMFP